MTRDPTYIAKMKHELRGLGNIRRLSDLKMLEEEVYQAPSDRARVILAASYLDDHIEMLIKTMLRSDLNSTEKRDLFDYEGAAGTLSSKIALAYGLGLMGKETQSDLNLVRVLRNEFAHSRFRADFAIAAVQEFCKHFKLVHRDDSYVGTRYRGLLKGHDDKTIVARSTFLATCDTLTHRIFYRLSGPMEGDIVFENDDPLP